jgi:hypothetical protein
VAVKVDREERPDVDAVYMQATQAMTGSGGWPMTVFATPDGRPFFAGTYYPPVRNGHMPAFAEVVTALAEVWATRRDEVVGSADQILAQLAQATDVATDAERPDPQATVNCLAVRPAHGVSAGPLFPPTTVLDALLVRGDPATPRSDVLTPWPAAARDQLAGGVPPLLGRRGWVVPHFEKMLTTTRCCWARTRNWRRVPAHYDSRRDLYADVVERLVGWLLLEMRLEAGAFAASLDADSARGGWPTRIFYVWSPVDAWEADGEA